MTILSITVFIWGVFIFYQGRSTKQKAPIPDTDQSRQQNSTHGWETKTSDRDGVTVTVTPVEIDLSSETSEWKFSIVLNTHSVNLDYDMTDITVLVDNDKEYKPLRWEGAPAGGHHREGLLIFAPITPYPQYLEMIIKNIGATERLFSWSLIK